MAMPPDSFFHRQEAELERFSTQRVREVTRLLESTRKDLYSAISGSEFNYRRIIDLNFQLDGISQDLQRNLRQVQPPTEPLAQMVVRQQTEAIALITAREGIFLNFNTLSTDVLRQFSLNEMRKITSITAVEQIQTLKAVLFSKAGVQGLNPRQVAKQLAGQDGVFSKKFPIVENILRTETSTVYNEQKLESIKQVNQAHGLTLNKKILETIDDSRNHPISQVLNGMVQLPEKPFRAKASKVEAIAAKLHRGRGGGGIFWTRIGEYYVGNRLPAHYRERGILIPTDEPPNSP